MYNAKVHPAGNNNLKHAYYMLVHTVMKDRLMDIHGQVWPPWVRTEVDAD